MVGEVWLCAGQSNMEWPVINSAQPTILASTADPAIRLFQVQRLSTPSPKRSAAGFWTIASPDRVRNWSAVAYSFALEMRKKLKVPIGIVQATWGGTKCESWLSPEAFNANPVLKPIFDRYLSEADGYSVRMEVYRAQMARWKKENFKADPGNKGFEMGYAEPAFSTEKWQSASIPGAWEQIEGREVDGAVWFRTEFTLPEDWRHQYLWLDVGQISDFDTTYINNIKVGGLDKREAKRRYLVQSTVFKPGKNTLAVRVWNQSGEGGIFGPTLRLRRLDRKGELTLDGTWKTKNELVIDAPKSELETKPVRPMGPGDPDAPGGPFNAMIAPLIPYAIKGVLWYQGEANLGQAEMYRELFPTLIKDWRGHWGQLGLPFYFVQLPAFGVPGREAGETSQWAEFREAQDSVLSIPNTGMVVTLDLGEPNSFHPTRKREVGERLAWLALDRTYAVSSPGICPLARAHEYIGSSIRVRFIHVQGGFKTADGGAIRGFEISGADGKWYPAEAKAEGVYVSLSSKNVVNPISARYGWADYPDANLVNSSGLPAAPFRF